MNNAQHRDLDIEHTGPGHGDVDLTFVFRQPDGGALFQTWTICECSAAGLRRHLGPPQRESVHTAETLQATGRAVMDTVGAIHLGEGL